VPCIIKLTEIYYIHIYYYVNIRYTSFDTGILTWYATNAAAYAERRCKQCLNRQSRTMLPISKDTSSRSARYYHSAAGRADKIRGSSGQSDAASRTCAHATGPINRSPSLVSLISPSHAFTVPMQPYVRPAPHSLQQSSLPARS
jgi:hypothetical protein